MNSEEETLNRAHEAVRQTEEALRESESRLQFVLDSAQIGDWDLDLVTLKARRSLTHDQIFGYDSLLPDWSYEMFLEHVHPEEREAVDQKFRRTLSTYENWDFECRIIRVDKKVRWIWATGSAYFDSNGKPIRLLGLVTDITEKKQDKATLHDTRIRLQAALDAGAIATWTFDLRNNRIVADKNLAQLFSVSPENASGGPLENYVRVIHPDDQKRVEDAIEAAIKRGGDYEAEYRIVQPDSSYRWVIARGRIECDATGNPVSLPGVVVDITERKEIEQALKQSEAKFRQLANCIPQLAWIASPDGWIFWYNKQWYEYTGTTPKQMEGWGWQSVHDPEMLPKVLERWQASILTGQPFEMEFPLRNAQGEFGWFLTRVNPFKDAEGQILLWFGTNTDVTEQKRLVEEKHELLESERAARSETERASRLKDEFLLTLSHELRTPLNAILGWSQLLHKGKMDAAKVAHGLDIIERNVRVQTQLIDDLLDMSRIISGKLRLNVQRVELGAVIEAALETVRLSAEVKNIRLQKVLDPLAGIVSGDPARLQQIVWNLLSNAIKFTQKGGRVQVVLERVNSHVEISVIDTGQGIKPEFLPYVFDRFRQADASTTRNHSGLGLGLAIVKQLTELHGGSVRVKSAGEGKGATFQIALPLLVVHPQEFETEDFDRNDAMSASGDYKEPTLDGVKVLVVDDEPDARELLKCVLEGCKAEVITAGSVQEALEALSHYKPHVLVSDIGMPQEDGYQFIRKVRELLPDQGGMIPAVALTAYARAEDRKRALLSGYQMHIAKPVEPSELVAVVVSLTSLMPKGQQGQ